MYRSLQEFQDRNSFHLRPTVCSTVDSLRHTVWSPVQSVGLLGLATSGRLPHQSNSGTRRDCPVPQPAVRCVSGRCPTCAACGLSAPASLCRSRVRYSFNHKRPHSVHPLHSFVCREYGRNNAIRFAAPIPQNQYTTSEHGEDHKPETSFLVVAESDAAIFLAETARQVDTKKPRNVRTIHQP